MRRRPRLVATDLDGTLLRSDGSLSVRTQRVLHEVAAVGVGVVLVTARPPRFLAPLAPLLPPSTLGICANGAMTYALTTGAVGALRPLPRRVAGRVVTTLAAAGVGFAVETGSSVVFEPEFARPDHGDVRLAVASLAEMWRHGRPIVKLLAWSSTRSAGELLTFAGGALGPVAECTYSGGMGLLEVSATGVTKASALRALCAARGIAADEVVAFGDMPNDVPMLDWAGRSYAVANAHPAVLAAATDRTATNDDDGVARVLERLR